MAIALETCVAAHVGQERPLACRSFEGQSPGMCPLRPDAQCPVSACQYSTQEPITLKPSRRAAAVSRLSRQTMSSVVGS